MTSSCAIFVIVREHIWTYCSQEPLFLTRYPVRHPNKYWVCVIIPVFLNSAIRRKYPHLSMIIIRVLYWEDCRNPAYILHRSELIVAYWCLTGCKNLATIFSDNGLSHVWRKAITRAIDAFCQMDLYEHDSVKFELRYKGCLSRKCRLQNSSHFRSILNVLTRQVLVICIYGFSTFVISACTIQWRHNGCDGVSDHQPHECLLNRFRRRSNKTSKLYVTGLCVGNSPVTGEFPTQRANNAENVSIWWRHHELPPSKYNGTITPQYPVECNYLSKWTQIFWNSGTDSHKYTESLFPINHSW